VNDAVDRVLAERQQLGDAFVSGFAVSGFAHLLLVGGALLASLLFPAQPPIQIVDGFTVQLPRGGGGSPDAGPPAPAPPKPAPSEPPAPKPEPPPKVVKPPKEETRKGLPDPDARKGKKKPEKSSPQPRGGAPGGTGTSTQTPGLSFGPPGPGVPGGSELGGDWYLAAVQQKIWSIWNQQIKAGFNQPVKVMFTILADGSVEDVKVVQSSGATLLDMAAQRAVVTAAPFGPLPKSYGTNRFPIQAAFEPTP
jgi:TonB family protein